jgi:hypothetical protein
MRICPFTGCHRRIPSDRFGCRTHWFSLSSELRARVWAAYNAYRAKEIELRELARLQREILKEHYGVTSRA